MKKIALGLLASTALFTAQASAADLGRPIYKAPVVVAQPMMWNGFYIGANGGLAAGDVGASLDPALAPISADLTSRGGFGGGQIGYNWQFSPNWVFGIEADYQGGSIEGSVGINLGGAALSIGSDTTAFGTVRGRLGYAAGSTLFYVTGGWAYGRNELFLESNLGANLSIRKGHTGYAVGAGVEQKFAGNWSAKVEYLYVDLGRENYDIGPALGAPIPVNIRADHQFHTMRVGLNYHFNWGGPIVASY
jgi:outer membrane immunogenic protein